jgi:Eco57I restriction-modification methylase/MmeI, target recognition domain
MSRMSTTSPDSDLEWLDHLQPVGLVVARSVLKDLGLVAIHQTPVDSGAVAELLEPDTEKPALTDPWKFVETVLGWEARHVDGARGSNPIPRELMVSLPEQGVVLSPTWAVMELGDATDLWQLLVRIEPPGVDPDERGALDGWEATPHQRFERLLRDTRVFAGMLISDHTLRLIYAPRGETSGYLTFPLRPLGTVAGRPMLGGLKLLLDGFRLFADGADRRLPALLKRSREAQASVSTALAGQVLGALHELLRGFDRAEGKLIRELAQTRPEHLYEGLLAALMRLVFVLYAEDRGLLPSRTDARAREVYEKSYSLRGLYARLTEDAALNPDTMEERRGAWGHLVALFRLVHTGHRSGFMQARGGKLFDPDEFPFLEGRHSQGDSPRVPSLSDGCILQILEGLMTLQMRGRERERLSYRALDVEQIGSVYETVMGFTVQPAPGRMLAIKAGKNNRTPVFVNLNELLRHKGKARLKHLKESTGRSQLSNTQANQIEAAVTVEDTAAALESIVDERAAPRKQITPADTPILQPTGERRRTGSYYTPRTLTEPIVKYALESTFARLTEDATPAQVLELRVCDPAMGSGAFLVAACRALGERLVKAWARWPNTRPQIPADEDEQLHARRIVAQRCLYGVDKNPRAVDLARLSLWLATLARDHEFTFLDHALKCGDSLVGLTRRQIESLHWDNTNDLPLFAGLLKEKLDAAVLGRQEIREAADDVSRVVQEARHRQVESQIESTRLIGTAIVAAFFGNTKPKAREVARQEIEVWANGPADEMWPHLEDLSLKLSAGDHPVLPFHWEIEFPEVFARAQPGFDAIVGNPPFAGKNTIIATNAKNYLVWLQALHEGAHGNADLVAHFFRRAFSLIRQEGAFGLIATNTIRQGDTRASGLAAIIRDGGAIERATRRLKWPGEAAVIVSVVHVMRGESVSPILDGARVRRISAYLVEGDLDTSPRALVANQGRSFIGSYLLNMGFTFDDVAAAKGETEDLAKMQALIEKDVQNVERIFPYIGGAEVNNEPRHAHHRFVIDFGDLPLRRDPVLESWNVMDSPQRQEALRLGIVPTDYPEPVAADWPELLNIVDERVRPARVTDNRPAYRTYWWRFAERRSRLRSAMSALRRVLVIGCGASAHLAFAFLPVGPVFAHTLTIVTYQSDAAFCVLQSRIHELWARFFSSSMKDDLRYTPSKCFRTFPFPRGFDTDATLEATGAAYYSHRAEMMVRRNEGLTKTYNRFHARNDHNADTERLRTLHAEMDAAVLRAYRWEDLAERASAQFIEQDADEGKTPKTRLDWPADFQDAVFSRLLALNAERTALESAAGISPVLEGDEDEEEYEEETDD